MISSLGEGALLGKMDIKSALKLLPVNPKDFELLGFKLNNEYLFQTPLPKGCSISCALFEKYSTFQNGPCFKNKTTKMQCIIWMTFCFMENRVVGNVNISCLSSNNFALTLGYL